MERSADQLDMAAQLEEQQTEQALLRQAKEAAKPQTHPDFDGLHCVDCEDDLPPVRLAYKRIRCTPCQEAEDNLKKRGLR